MKKKKTVINIPYIACLKYKYGPIEIHLKGDGFHYSPLNYIQQFSWWSLGFKYIHGDDYVDYLYEHSDYFLNNECS